MPDPGPVYVVDAFTESAFGGNPAGIVLASGHVLYRLGFTGRISFSTPILEGMLVAPVLTFDTTG